MPTLNADFCSQLAHDTFVGATSIQIPFVRLAIKVHNVAMTGFNFGSTRRLHKTRMGNIYRLIVKLIPDAALALRIRGPVSHHSLPMKSSSHRHKDRAKNNCPIVAFRSAKDAWLSRSERRH